jgi:hypothetical protein
MNTIALIVIILGMAGFFGLIYYLAKEIEKA